MEALQDQKYLHTPLKIIEDQEMVNVEEFGNLVGFPKEVLIQELILQDQIDEEGRVFLPVLRERMLRYLNDVFVQ